MLCQVLAHNACLLRHRTQSEWLLFMDPDEFLHFGDAAARTPAALHRWLREQPASVTELSIKNMVFGGLPEKQHGSVLERFTWRSPSAERYCREKFFARSSNTQAVFIHGVTRFECGRRFVVDPDQVRVNHYFNAVQTGDVTRNQEQRWAKSAEVHDESAAWASDFIQEAYDELPNWKIA